MCSVIENCLQCYVSQLLINNNNNNNIHISIPPQVVTSAAVVAQVNNCIICPTWARSKSLVICHTLARYYLSHLGQIKVISYLSHLGQVLFVTPGPGQSHQLFVTPWPGIICHTWARSKWLVICHTLTSVFVTALCALMMFIAKCCNIAVFVIFATVQETVTTIMKLYGQISNGIVIMLLNLPGGSTLQWARFAVPGTPIVLMMIPEDCDSRQNRWHTTKPFYINYHSSYLLFVSSFIIIIR